MHLAILEDDTSLGQALEQWLRSAGHDCLWYQNGGHLLRELKRQNFDLLLLDWEVPDASGVEVLEWVRHNLDKPMPVIFVTYHDSEQDIVTVLNRGADDYLIKPVRQAELLARVDAVWRRYRKEESSCLTLGSYRLEKAGRKMFLHDREIALTEREFELAWLLFRNIGQLLPRGQVLEAVWGLSEQVLTRTIDTHISRLRRKLELTPDNGVRLVSVYSYGYRLEKVN